MNDIKIRIDNTKEEICFIADVFSIGEIAEILEYPMENKDIKYINSYIPLFELLDKFCKLGHLNFYKAQLIDDCRFSIRKYHMAKENGKYKNLNNLVFKKSEILKCKDLLYTNLHNKTSEYMFADFLEAYPEVKFMYEKHCDGVDRAGILRALLDEEIVSSSSQAAFLTKNAHTFKSDAALKKAADRAKRKN